MEGNKKGLIIGITIALFIVVTFFVMRFVLSMWNVSPMPVIPVKSETLMVQEIAAKPQSESKKSGKSESKTNTEKDKVKNEYKLHEKVYEVGKFGPSIARKNYESGTMTLHIPRLDFEGPVLGGVDVLTLKKGVGLFNQSMLPGPENANVSIAGHRDIHGCEFYYIDTMQEGDYIYLTYKNKRYKYEYEETFVTHNRNWSPIAVKDYSRITLQSCTPIGIASDRIFVTGKLVEIKEIKTDTNKK